MSTTTGSTGSTIGNSMSSGGGGAPRSSQSSPTASRVSSTATGNGGGVCQPERLQFHVRGRVFNYEGLPKNRERDLFDLLLMKQREVPREKICSCVRENRIEFSPLSSQGSFPGTTTQQLSQDEASEKQDRQGDGIPRPDSLSRDSSLLDSSPVGQGSSSPLQSATDMSDDEILARYDAFVASKQSREGPGTSTATASTPLTVGTRQRESSPLASTPIEYAAMSSREGSSREEAGTGRRLELGGSHSPLRQSTTGQQRSTADSWTTATVLYWKDRCTELEQELKKEREEHVAETQKLTNMIVELRKQVQQERHQREQLALQFGAVLSQDTGTGNHRTAGSHINKGGSSASNDGVESCSDAGDSVVFHSSCSDEDEKEDKKALKEGTPTTGGTLRAKDLESMEGNPNQLGVIVPSAFSPPPVVAHDIEAATEELEIRRGTNTAHWFEVSLLQVALSHYGALLQEALATNHSSFTATASPAGGTAENSDEEESPLNTDPRVGSVGDGGGGSKESRPRSIGRKKATSKRREKQTFKPHQSVVRAYARLCGNEPIISIEDDLGVAPSFAAENLSPSLHKHFQGGGKVSSSASGSSSLQLQRRRGHTVSVAGAISPLLVPTTLPSQKRSEEGEQVESQTPTSSPLLPPPTDNQGEHHRTWSGQQALAALGAGTPPTTPSSAARSLRSDQVLIEYRMFPCFSSIVHAFELRPAELMLAAMQCSWRLTLSPGKSDTKFFYFGHFVLKTVNDSESEFAEETFLPEYLHYVQEHHQGTLLPKLYSMFTVVFRKTGERTTYLLYNNVLRTRAVVNKVFDLKGSSFGRDGRAKPASGSSGEDGGVGGAGDPLGKALVRTNAGAPLLKDNDLPKERRLLHLGGQQKAAVIAQLRSDTAFLERLSVIDYSLLVGVSLRREFLEGEADAKTDGASGGVSLPPDALKSVSNRRQEDDWEIAMLGTGGSALDVLHSHNTSGSPPDGTGGRPKRSKQTEESTCGSAESPTADDANIEGLGATVFESIPRRASVLPRAPLRTGRSTRSAGPQGDVLKEETYYLGIIDVLQTYNSRKKLENFAKGLLVNRHRISVVPPDEFAQRLCVLIERISL